MRIPKAKRSYDWRTREGKINRSVITLELLAHQIATQANDQIRQIKEAIDSLKKKKGKK